MEANLQAKLTKSTYPSANPAAGQFQVTRERIRKLEGFIELPGA
jgi:hypothetical protein